MRYQLNWTSTVVLLASLGAGCASTGLEPHWEHQLGWMDGIVPRCNLGMAGDSYLEASALWHQTYPGATGEIYQEWQFRGQQAPYEHLDYFCGNAQKVVWKWRADLSRAARLPSAVATSTPAPSAPAGATSADALGPTPPVDVWIHR